MSAAADKISLDELTALCDEMVSLSRAGIPLDRGLVKLAADLPGRLSAQAQQIGERLEAGQNLADVVANDDSPFPRVYKHIIEAGLRSGRLTVALEGFARLARQLSELRRLVASALVYPLLLMAVLSGISLVLVRQFGTDVHGAMDALFGPRGLPDGYDSMLGLFAWLCRWFWLLPVTMFLLGCLWYLISRSATTRNRKINRWVYWIPGAKRLLHNSRLQAFTEVLAMLVHQEVPLTTSLRLAGASSGDQDLQADADRLADQIQRGEQSEEATESSAVKHGIPTFIRWSLLNSQASGKLEATLSRASETYRRRTENAAMWMRVFMPVIFSSLFGGVVSVIYAALVFFPWYTMLQALGNAMESL